MGVLATMTVRYRVDASSLRSENAASKASLQDVASVAKQTTASLKQLSNAAQGSKMVTETDVAQARLTLLQDQAQRARQKLQMLKDSADAGQSITGIPVAEAKLSLLEAKVLDAEAQLKSLGVVGKQTGTDLATGGEKATTSLREVSESSTSASRTVRQSISGMITSVRELGTASVEAGKTFGSSTRGMISSLLDFGSKLGLSIISLQGLYQGVIGFGKALFGSNATMEQTKIAFSSFLGEGQKTDSFLKKLASFANTTPFEFPEVQDASLKLLNMGVAAQDVTQWLGNIGAAVSKVGGSGSDLSAIALILQQMSNEGKISNDNLQQLANHNIPIYQLLADKMGVTIPVLQQMAASGELGTDKIQLLSDVLGQFGGDAMTKQGKTFLGMLSTLKDNASAALRAFSGPLFDMAEGGLEHLGSLLSAPAFQDFATGAGQQVAGVFGNIGKAVSGAVDWVKRLDLDGLRSSWDQLTESVGRFLLPVSNIGATLGNVLPSFDSVKQTLSSLATGGIETVSGILQGLSQTFDSLSQHVDLKDILDAVGGAFQRVSDIVGGQVGQNLQTVGQTVQQVGQWFQTDMLPALEAAWPGFEHFGEAIMTTVVPGIAKIWEVGQGLAREFLPKLIEGFETVEPVLVRVGGFLYDKLGSAIEFLTPFVVQAAQEIGKFAGEIGERVIPIVQGLWTDLKTGLDWIRPYWPAIWNTIKTDFQFFWDFISGAVKIGWSIVTGLFKFNMDIIGGHWSDAWNDIKNTLSGVWDGIKQMLGGIGGSIWGYMKSGLNSAIDGINQFIDIVDGIHVNIGGHDFGGPQIPHIPRLHTGGVIPAGGWGIAGDPSPNQELIYGGTTGATVFNPAQTATILAGVNGGGFNGGSSRPQEIHVHVYVGNEEVTHHVAEAAMEMIVTGLYNQGPVPGVA